MASTTFALVGAALSFLLRLHVPNFLTFITSVVPRTTTTSPVTLRVLFRELALPVSRPAAARGACTAIIVFVALILGAARSAPSMRCQATLARRVVPWLKWFYLEGLLISIRQPIAIPD